MMTILGIDLGTTNSLVSYFDEAPKLIKNSLDMVMTPSVVEIERSGALTVGETARRNRIVHDNSTASRFKRFMGSEKTVLLGRKRYSAIDLSSMILRQLKADAELHLGQQVNQAIISVPAYFNAVQRQATKDAAALAGLKVERLINEPTAAALAYGLNTIKDVNKVIVLDLGGGTFDVSLVEIFDGVIEVHASAGDALLGGEDFTELLAKYLAKEIGEEWSNILGDRRQYLLETAELFKIRLSQNNSVTLNVKTESTEKEIVLTAPIFEEICNSLMLRLRRPIEKCLYDSQTAREDIDKVILVGGATRMPMIRSMASRIFRALPERSIDPDHVVALGCAVQAGLAEKNEALDDVVMTDVAPFSMGVAVHNHDNVNRLLYSPVIMRNTTLPCSRQNNYRTVVTNQRSLRFCIHQGEAPYADDNTMLGEIDVPVPPAPAGQESANIRFTYDVSGLLSVDTEVVSTGTKRSIVINGAASGLSEEEIAKKIKELESLKTHPRDNHRNRALVGRLTQLCELLLGYEREIALSLLLRFERELEGQDPEKIARIEREISAEAEKLEANYGL